jgi:hypothetical protein
LVLSGVLYRPISELSFLETAHYTYCLFLAGYFLGLLINPEDGGGTFLQKIDGLQLDHTALYPKR